jgi:hypothetical protein
MRLRISAAAFIVLVVALVTAWGSTAAVSPKLTSGHAYRQIRACLLQRGFFVRPSSDPGGGFAFWGSDHTGSGRWGSWSLTLIGRPGRVAGISRIVSRRLQQRPRKACAFRYCTRWPR